MLGGFQSNIYSSQKTIHLLLHNVSVNSKPDHPPGRPSGIRTYKSPLGSGFCSSVLPGGILNQKKSSTILKKRDFALVSKANE